MENARPDITAPIMIEEDAALLELCARWSQKAVLAMDTEFIRVDTFYPKLGLLQVCDGEGSYLLDPLRLSNWEPFKELLRSPSIVKVFHSCSEDLIVFNDFFELIPSPLFDSQRAAAFLGYGYSISYQNLVESILGITLAKGETRSDWLQRPLTQNQLTYAALDVAYLSEIYADLSKRLTEKGRLPWVTYDCDELVSSANNDVAETQWDDSYQTVGGAWRLEQKQLEALKRLCQWREIQARKRDKPRNWIAKDTDLIAICEAMPGDAKALAEIPNLSRHLARQDAQIVIEILGRPHQGAAIGQDKVEQPLTPAMRKTLKRCQEVVKTKAAALDIAPELLARKKQLMPLVTQQARSVPIQWPQSLSGWRQELLEQDLRAALE
jgi:ribonuclease D